MPKIPLPQSSGIQHTAGTAPLAMRGNLATPRNNDAENIAAAGNTVLTAGNRVVNAMLDWREKKVDTENLLAAADDRAELKNSAELLRSRIAQNPGAPDEEKEEWVREWELEYAQKHREISSRMTEGFRARHEKEIASLSRSVANDRRYTIMQSSVQRQLDIFSKQFDDACARGDFAEAGDLVSQHEGVLISPDRAAYLREQFLPQKEQVFAVKALAENDPRTALAQLQKQTADGKPEAYDLLPADYRSQLIGFCKQKIFDADRQVRTEFLYQLSRGNVNMNEENIDQLVNTGQLSPAAAVQMKADLRNFRQSEEISKAKEETAVVNGYRDDLLFTGSRWSDAEIDAKVTDGILTVNQANRIKEINRRYDEDHANTAAAQYLYSLRKGGRQYSEEELLEMVENGKISDRQAEKFREVNRAFAAGDKRDLAEKEQKILDRFNASVAQNEPIYSRSDIFSLFENGDISPALFARMVGISENYTARKSRLTQLQNEQQAKELQQRKSRLEDSFKYIVFKTEFSSDPAAAVKQQQQLIDLSRKWFPGEPKTLLEMEEEINRRYNEAGKKDAIFNTPAGKTVDEYIQSQMGMKNGGILRELLIKNAGILPDGAWKCYEYAEDMLKKGESVENIKKGLDTMIYLGNTEEIDRILSQKNPKKTPFDQVYGSSIELNGEFFYIDAAGSPVPVRANQQEWSDENLLTMETAVVDVDKDTTWVELAEKYGISEKNLKKLNISAEDAAKFNKEFGNKVPAGTVIIIPGGGK